MVAAGIRKNGSTQCCEHNSLTIRVTQITPLWLAYEACLGVFASRFGGQVGQGNARCLITEVPAKDYCIFFSSLGILNEC